MTVLNWNGKSYDTAYLSTVPYAYLTPTLAGTGETSPWIFAAFADGLAQVNLNVISSAAGLVATSTGSATIQTGSQSLNVGPGKSFTAGAFVAIYNTPASGNYMLSQVTSYDSGTGDLVFNTALGDTGGAGTFTAWTIVVSGRKGNQGPAGFSYAFDGGTTNADPGPGRLRFNQATAPATTAIYVDDVEAGGASIAAWLGDIAASTSANKGRLIVRSQTDPTKWAMFTLSAASALTGYSALTVAAAAYSTASPFADGGAVMMDFIATGDKGDIGPPGPDGSGSTLNFYAAGTLVSAAPRAALNLIGAAAVADNSGAGRVDVTVHPMTTAGDIVYGGVAGAQTRLPIGGAAKVLSPVAGVPSWISVPPLDLVIVTRTANTPLDASNKGQLIDITANSFTQTVAAVATLDPNWWCVIRYSGNGVITLDPDLAETVDGLPTILIYPGEAFTLVRAGSALKTWGRDRCVKLSTVTVSSAVATVDLETGFLDPEIKAVRVVGSNVTNSTTAIPWLRAKYSGAYRTTTYLYSAIFNDGSALAAGGAAAGSSVALLSSNLNTGRVANFTADVSAIKTSVNGAAIIEARLVGNPSAGSAPMGHAIGVNTGGAAIEGLQFLWSTGNVAGNVATATFDVWGYRG